MSRWLGKNYLGQSEKAELIHRGLDIKIEVSSNTEGEQVDRFLKREVKKSELNIQDTDYEEITDA